MQPVDFRLQSFSSVAIETVGDQKHHRTLRQDSPRPFGIEFVQCVTDARAARPVIDGFGTFIKRFVDILVPKIARDIGQPRPEKERVYPVAVIGDGMQEMQDHARIAAHRPGNIAQHNQRRVAAQAPAPLQWNNAAAGA